MFDEFDEMSSEEYAVMREISDAEWVMFLAEQDRRNLLRCEVI